jgi:hypothetical protein
MKLSAISFQLSAISYQLSAKARAAHRAVAPNGLGRFDVEAGHTPTRRLVAWPS